MTGTTNPDRRPARGQEEAGPRKKITLIEGGVGKTKDNEGKAFDPEEAVEPDYDIRNFLK